MSSGPFAFEIQDPGLLATTQDLGRAGAGVCGVSPAGAADWLSARIANRLVGNPPDAALIETTMTGVTFVALETLRIAVTGADAPVVIAGGDKPQWQSLRVRAGNQVKVGAATRGLRSYVAFAGGIDAPLLFGSASTDTTSGFGGPGRALVRGDTLRLHPRDGELVETETTISGSSRPFWRQPATVRVLEGPHAGRLSHTDLESLCAQTYRVSPRSNRQGLRLEGRPLAAGGGFDVLSCGVCAGCVQIASDGLPVLLLAEHQTTGGYAVALVAISADLPDAAQLRPGDGIRFQRVTRAQAVQALVEKTEGLREALHEPSRAG